MVKKSTDTRDTLNIESRVTSEPPCTVTASVLSYLDITRNSRNKDSNGPLGRSHYRITFPITVSRRHPATKVTGYRFGHATCEYGGSETSVCTHQTIKCHHLIAINLSLQHIRGFTCTRASCGDMALGNVLCLNWKTVVERREFAGPVVTRSASNCDTRLIGPV